MTAKLTPNLRLRNAQDFLENLVNHPITPPQTAADGSHKVDRSHYVFVGRTKEWPTNLLANPVVSEYSPPSPQNTVAEDLETRDHMIALKKVRDVDATLVVRRFNWDQSGQTVYAPYDISDAELFNHPTQAEIQAANVNGTYKAGSHYVITEDYHIFKCLSNGNGAKSTVKPTLPLSPPFTVSGVDGYVWKYLGTVTNFQTQYFLTNQWIPVKKLIDDSGTNQWDVQVSAVDGAIDSYLIANAGNDYINVYSGTFDASGVNTATLPEGPTRSLIDDAYKNSLVWITGGTGFPSGPFLITSYVAATRTITISGTWGVDATTTFEILPRAVVSGNGSGATAKVLVDTSTNKVKQVLPVEFGSGYSNATVEIFGGTTGTPATVVPQIPPPGGHGSDIERELNACFVMLTARLPYDDGTQDFPLSNDYRQVGIIRDVKKLNGELANAQTLRASRGIKLTSVATGAGGAFQPDELIIGTNGVTTARARIIAIVNGPGPTDASIHFYQDSSTGYDSFVAGMAVTGSTTNATGNIPVGGLIDSEIQKLSGDILYIDNRRAVLRAPNQTEILRAVIKF
jgi:hypothetical protein